MQHDLKIEYVPIDQLVFADYNPRKASQKEFDALKENIEKFGFVDPILVNSNESRKNVIIGGHFRVRVAKAIGMESVPAVFVDIADIEKEKELNVRLNKNTGSFDFEMLANVFEVADLTNWGFTLGELGMSEGNGKDQIDVDNMASGLETYMNSGIKQIVLYVKSADFLDLTKRLDAIMPELGAENYTEVFLKLLENHENSGGLDQIM